MEVNIKYTETLYAIQKIFFFEKYGRLQGKSKFVFIFRGE